MKSKIAMSLLLVFYVTASFAYAGEWVTFNGTSKSGDAFLLKGILTKPKGEGPFPAVVLLHGCGGIRGDRDAQWAKRLADWGYVTFQVDSFGPRGISSVCTDFDLIGSILPKRTQDAYDAKSYLLTFPFIDRNRIAVMGWGHGSMTTLLVVDQKRNDPFHASIAFYPSCNRPLFGFNAPLLILHGEKDDWASANSCSMRMRSGQTEPEIILKIYPDSYHGFDGEGLDIVLAGLDGNHRLLYNPVAAADAIIQIKAFLAKHLK